ncbi:TRAP transporter substrate-binding protein (plasmid) [Acidovorax sp. DW039]|uniref:TRAP transporter substrate-binding protein n=1 Tax=Acidovorax sp. DW039 TaxID=3095606 RepID=UPI0030887D15|nr:TRAP transporter substrate-binding protein [Acidovorax sp. DW039]
MRKKLSSLALIIGVLITAPLAMAQSTAKLGYGAVEDHPQGVAARKFAELVKVKTSGRVTINTYGSGKLGSDPAMQSSVQGGTLEMMVGPTSNLVGSIKEYAIFDLPYLVSSYNEADGMLDGPVGQQLAAKLEAFGLVGLSYWENGFRSVTNSKRPIQRLEDLSGLKIRVIQNPVFIETFKALGANPVPMPFTELYGALESKAVDAQENPIGLIESSKFYEVQKYMSLTSHVYSPFILLASKKWVDRLSAADKIAVKEAAQEAAKFQRQLQRDQNAKLMASVKAQGMQINELSPSELQRLRDAVRPVVIKFANEIGPDLVKQIGSLKN